MSIGLEEKNDNFEPAVSVVICAYNVERYISAAIDSVLQQTYRNIEIIVVDDASTDSTVQVVEDLLNSCRRIRLIRVNSNGGLARTRMIGLENSVSDLIVFLDADDIALPSMIEQQVTTLLSEPLLMGVATYACYIAEDENKLLGMQKVGPISREEYFNLYENNKLIFLPATTLCRKSLLIEAGGFRVDGFPTDGSTRFQDYCDDLDLWCRMSDLSAQGWFFVTIPQPLFLYRKNLNSLSSRNIFAMQRKMRWIKNSLLRRRNGIGEKTFVAYESSQTGWQAINNYRKDYAALIYRKAAFSVMSKKYFRVMPLIAIVLVLHPKLVLNKLRTQSIRLSFDAKI